MNFENIKNFTNSAFQKLKNISPKQVAFIIVVIVSAFCALRAFAYTDNADGSVTLTAQEVQLLNARFTAAIQAMQQMSVKIDEDAAVIEKLEKQIEVGPNKTCL